MQEYCPEHNKKQYFLDNSSSKMVQPCQPLGKKSVIEGWITLNNPTINYLADKLTTIFDYEQIKPLKMKHSSKSHQSSQK